MESVLQLGEVRGEGGEKWMNWVDGWLALKWMVIAGQPQSEVAMKEISEK